MELSELNNLYLRKKIEHERQVAENKESVEQLKASVAKMSDSDIEFAKSLGINPDFLKNIDFERATKDAEYVQTVNQEIDSLKDKLSKKMEELLNEN